MEQRGRKKLDMTWIWWVILLGLIAWNVIGLLPRDTSSATIPYSTFLREVRAGNVSYVMISGTEITGNFREEVLWPQDTTDPDALPSERSQTPQRYTRFRTTFPDAVGDPELLATLEAEGVTVEAQPPPSPFLGVLLANILPLALLVGLMVWMARRMTQGQTSGLTDFGRSRARRHVSTHTDITFEDVAGADEAKADLKEVVDFLRYPAKYHTLGARIPKGVLLVGPPGTGKTLMARAVAGEANVPFYSISASEFVEMFVGVGASRVRDLFERAKQTSPAIVFIDELDAVGRRRGAGVGTVNDEREQTLNQLLVEMDGFDERHEVIIMAATNRPDVLDPALLRPGRFDREVVVGLPDRKGREEILRIHTRHLNLSPEVDLGTLAGATTGLSGADLANLANEAALVAARRNHRQVSADDFDEAIDRVLLGGARSVLLNERDRQVIAFHEAGHALVAWLTPNADPVHKVSIIPHGQALGVTKQVPKEDRYNLGREYLLGRLAVMLGGRAAEEIALDDITTGAESDLVEATRLARRMVTRWGMGSLGPMALDTNDEEPFLGYSLSQGREVSEETASRIDREVQGLIEQQHRSVCDLLTEHREMLDDLVEALLAEESVDEARLAKVLGPGTRRTANVPVGV
jgi:cell division protease FtsH